MSLIFHGERTQHKIPLKFEGRTYKAVKVNIIFKRKRQFKLKTTHV